MIYPEYQAYKKEKTVENKVELLPTEDDSEGPFYLPDAPIRFKFTEKPTLKLIGKVLNVKGEPIPNAILDFWHADDKGEYDNKGFNFRGKVVSDAGGNYYLETIHPGDYKISETEFRCSHIHVKVDAEGFIHLTTQLYFSNDEYNSTDHWFSKNRIIREFDNENGHFGEFDFILVENK